MEWDDIVCAEAMTWLGTPYVPRARVRGVGADCGTFLYACYALIRTLPPMPKDYAVDWSAHKNDELYLNFVMPFVKQVPVVPRGGFSLFRLGLAYAHAAIKLDETRYIHAWGRKGDGAVTITPARVLNALSKQHPPKHFEPI
jgi:cell wall-associated NlpC family hydrolase